MGLRIPKLKVPNKQTSYMCQLFDLSSIGNNTYHMIGTKPIIDNEDITHHILLFGCDETSKQNFIFYNRRLWLCCYLVFERI